MPSLLQFTLTSNSSEYMYSDCVAFPTSLNKLDSSTSVKKKVARPSLDLMPNRPSDLAATPWRSGSHLEITAVCLSLPARRKKPRNDFDLTSSSSSSICLVSRVGADHAGGES
jgi:hypothetical protein